jgi:hypothetical protein
MPWRAFPKSTVVLFKRNMEAMKKLVAVLMLVLSLNAVSVFAEEPQGIDPETQSTPETTDGGSPATPSPSEGESGQENPHH